MSSNNKNLLYGCSRAASATGYSLSPCPSHSSYNEVPPPPPPRCSSSTSSTPSHYPQYLKRISPATAPSRNFVQSQSPARGSSPVAANGNMRQAMFVQSRPQSQQQQLQRSLNMYQNGVTLAEPPPPYPIATLAPLSYTATMNSRQSPTQEYRKSPSSGI